MLTVKFGEQTYEFPLQEALKDLTGEESAVIEDYVGGWEKFQANGNATRSLIVIVYLAKHYAGETTTLEEIAATKGLVFGDIVAVSGDPESPDDPMTVPSRPLAATNDASESNDGSTGSEATAEISEATGTPLSSVSTG